MYLHVECDQYVTWDMFKIVFYVWVSMEARKNILSQIGYMTNKHDILRLNMIDHKYT